MAKLLAVFCAALFSSLAIAPASARAAVPDQPSALFTVQLASVNGSGCPPGSAAVRATSAMTFTVTYSQYIADAGGGANPADFRKNCQLNLNVGVPAGWTFGIASEQYRLFANLDAGARGTVEADYYFSGVAGNFPVSKSLSGPTSGLYEFDNAQPVITWAPCNFTGTVNIDTSLQVFPGSNPSFFNEMTMNSTDSPRLAFQRC